MATFLKSETLILTLCFLSTLTAFNAEPIINGDVHEILPYYGLPPGLFPNVSNHASIEPNGEMTVDLSHDCFYPFPFSGFRYEKKFTGIISYGRIKNVKGLYLLRQEPWFSVIAIEVKVIHPPTVNILFDTGSSSSMLFYWEFFNPIPQCFKEEGVFKIRDTTAA